MQSVLHGSINYLLLAFASCNASHVFVYATSISRHVEVSFLMNLGLHVSIEFDIYMPCMSCTSLQLL